MPTAPETAPSCSPTPRRFRVLRDTREKEGQGWTFPATNSCLGTVVRTLRTGDYAVEGLEAVCCVERKGSLGEFVGNLYQARFAAELARMADFAHPIVALEFDLGDVQAWPARSGIPPRRRRFLRVKNGTAILKRLTELQAEYPHVQFQFVGPHGAAYVASLFKRLHARHAPGPDAPPAD